MPNMVSIRLYVFICMIPKYIIQLIECSFSHVKVPAAWYQSARSHVFCEGKGTTNYLCRSQCTLYLLLPNTQLAMQNTICTTVFQNKTFDWKLS